MYDLLMDCDVTMVVGPRADSAYLYSGTLVQENEKTVVLKNCTIEMAGTQAQKNMSWVGNSAFILQKDLESVIINKEYVVSCNKQ